MVRIDQSITIEKSIEDVFGYIQEINRQPEWASALQESVKMSGGSTGVGTAYRQVAKLLGRRIEMSCEVTRYEPPRVFEFHVQGGPMHGHMRFTLTTDGNGTRIDHVAEGEPGGIFRIADSLAARGMKKQFATDLENLKLLLESGLAAEPAAE